MFSQSDLISVIIPTRNEEAVLAATLQSALAPGGIEVLVVDGGSSDETINIALLHDVRVIQSLPGKARQMNAGASAASGTILLFLHADTILPPAFDQHVRSAIMKPGVAVGAFRLGISLDSLCMRWIEFWANLRSQYLQLPYGDQALFVARTTFETLGGYQQLSIMEDFDFVRRARRVGSISLIGAKVLTSARRWQQLGAFRTTFMNQLTILAYYFGIPTGRIAKLYRRQLKGM